MQANGVNYYKGVLLCSRPNQSPSVQRDKPFCGRVYPSQQLGLVPTKQYGQRKTKKRQLPVLNNHKKWLEKFKQDIGQKKVQQEQQQRKKEEALQKIRQQGRDRLKQVTTKEFVGNNNESVINNQIQNYSAVNNNSAPKQQQKQPASTKQLKPSQPNTRNAHKKKSKPAWANTQQQYQQQQQQQLDDLLDFFQKGETQQVKDYVNDDDIKKILVQLKNKIEVLREQGGEWKEKELIKIEDQNNRENQQRRRARNGDQKDDILSRISKQSGSQSISSQKTVDRVQQLQKKKQTKQWDKLTTTSKSSIASVDEQIAKHIADQILRNYPNMKHHSNQSIRKLLQKQAKQQLKV